MGRDASARPGGRHHHGRGHQHHVLDDVLRREGRGVGGAGEQPPGNSTSGDIASIICAPIGHAPARRNPPVAKHRPTATSSSAATIASPAPGGTSPKVSAVVVLVARPSMGPRPREEPESPEGHEDESQAYAQQRYAVGDEPAVRGGVQPVEPLE